LKSIALLACGLLLAGAALAVPLHPYTAIYDVSRNGSVAGRATVTMQPSGDHWSIDSVTTGTHGLAALAAADIREHSEFRDSGGQLETLGYRYSQKTILKSTERSIRVDNAAGRIFSSDKKGEHEFPLQPGVLDHQSLSVAMAQDLASGKRGTLSYSVVDKDQLGIQHYRVGKQGTTRVPAGTLRTVNVVRMRESANGRVTASWLGLDNGFVPVRVVQTEPNGEVYEMELVSLKR
jgi:hypothetical protein